MDELVARGADQALLVDIRIARGRDGEDNAAIDLTLHTESSTTTPEPPPLGTGYAGLTPAQRKAFLTWAAKPDQETAPAYRQLYVANLEPALLESPAKRTAALAHLRELLVIPAWQGNPWLGRAYALGCRLADDGEALAAVLGQGGLPADLLGVGLGLQALLHTPLTVAELGMVQHAWRQGEPLSDELLKLRLASLTTNLGAEPLTYALAQVGEAATQPRPWRTAHPNLRLALPQPDLRPALEPLLREMNLVADVVPDDDDEIDAATDADEDTTSRAWQLILEFGHSRSENFDYLLGLCRRLPGFSQIMDQDRRLVYRVAFRRSEMRRFWRIWDYVQGWSTTRVYVNGDELEKWKIWPYSQYMS